MKPCSSAQGLVDKDSKEPEVQTTRFESRAFEALVLSSAFLVMVSLLNGAN